MMIVLLEFDAAEEPVAEHLKSPFWEDKGSKPASVVVVPSDPT